MSEDPAVIEAGELPIRADDSYVHSGPRGLPRVARVRGIVGPSFYGLIYLPSLEFRKGTMSTTPRRRHKGGHTFRLPSEKVLQQDVRQWSPLPLSLVVALPLLANVGLVIMVGIHLRSEVWRWQDLSFPAMGVLGVLPLLAVIWWDLAMRWGKFGRRRKAKRLGIGVIAPPPPPTD